MPLSSRILRGLDIKGSVVYSAPSPEEKRMENAPFPETESLAEIDPREQAEAFLKKAREEFAEERSRLLRDAGEEARLLKEKAREEGYAEGLKKGELEAAGLRKEAEEILKQAEQKRIDILARAEPDIIRIAVSIAEKLLNYKVETDSSCILQLIYRALEALPGGRNITLYVNPLDAKICQENFQRLQGRLKNDISLEVHADEEMPLGSCRVESEESQVELLPQKELEILSKKLLKLASSAAEDVIQKAE
ncbi:MAG: FliH/SctL family protein [Dethiobacteria bacterium]|jgi:flagellar assembly protein FliH